MILISGSHIWGYVEGALILTGKINKDSNNEELEKPVPEGSKSKIAAGILAVTIGCLGIHNFYLGNMGKAIGQLLLTVLGSCILIGPLAAYIWALVEGVQIFMGKVEKDGKGVQLFND